VLIKFSIGKQNHNFKEEKSMKKFFIALSVLAALMLGVVPAQALMGMPDDQPGADAIVPFICSTDLASGTGLNTLIAFTELGARETGSTLDRSLDFNWDLMTVRSATIADGTLRGTGHAVVSTDAKTLVNEVASGDLSALQVVIDGTTFYAGYVYFQNNNIVAATSNSMIAANNHIVGQFLYVNLAIGQAAGANIPMLEYNNRIDGNWNTATAMTTGTYLEEFSPDALASAMSLQVNGAVTTATAFGLYPRFYIPASGDANWLINWQCQNGISGTTPAANGLNTIHLNVYQADEQVRSTSVSWPNEVNILDVEAELPSGLFATYPKEGWFQFLWAGSGDLLVANVGDVSMFAFNYMIANGSAGEAWTVLNPVPRAANIAD
jgi:hypothetical protein